MIETGTERGHSSSPDLHVFKIDPHSDPRWRDFILAHPKGSIYHHPGWIQAIETEYGHRGEHLACEGAGGAILAILPLLHTRGLPFRLGGSLAGRRLSSLPRTPLGGPLSVDRHATVALVGKAMSLARQDPRCQLQIKAGGPELDGLVDGLVSTPWRLTYILQLPEASKEPFRIPDPRERSKIKWAISKAAKMGLTLRPAETVADLRNWYRVYLETMRLSLVPPRPFRFFAALWTLLRPTGMMELLLAEFGEGPLRAVIAGSVFLFCGRTVSYSFSAMNRKYGSLRANDAIQWQAINDASARGFHYFDFGEVPEGHNSLAKFKTKWGAQPERLYRYYSPAPPLPLIEDPGGSSSIAQAIWRKLPLKATEWLGDRLYSYL